MFFDLILLLERKIYVILPPKCIGENDSANVVSIVRRELRRRKLKLLEYIYGRTTRAFIQKLRY